MPDPPHIPPEVFELFGISRSDIDRATVPKTARGERAVGVSSGYMTAVLAGEARLRYGAILFNLERACEKINEYWGMLVENVIPNKVTVWADTKVEHLDATVSGDDFKGYYQNSVTLSAVAPEEESRKIHDGISLYGAGLASRRYVQERFIGMENPSEDDQQRLIEDLLASPQVQQILAGALMQTQEMQERVQSLVPEMGANQLVDTGGNPIGNRGNYPRGSEAMQTRTGTPWNTPMRMGSAEDMDRTVRQLGQGSLQAPTMRGGGI